MSPVTLEVPFADCLVTSLYLSREGTYPQVDRTNAWSPDVASQTWGGMGAPAGSQLTSGAGGGPTSEAGRLRGLSQHLPLLTLLSCLYCPFPAQCCCFLHVFSVSFLTGRLTEQRMLGLHFHATGYFGPCLSCNGGV